MVKQKMDEACVRDETVRKLVESMRQEGWKVKANLDREEKPSKIGAVTPDIEATKGNCLRRICQVVTEKDFEGNRQAYIEFKNYCDEYDFHFFVVDKEGKRREIDSGKLGKK